MSSGGGVPSAAEVREDAAIALSDADLIRNVHEWYFLLEDDDAKEALDVLLEEVFERFVPDAYWDEWHRFHLEDDPDTLDDVLEGLREAMQRREAKRLVRRAFDA